MKIKTAKENRQVITQFNIVRTQNEYTRTLKMQEEKVKTEKNAREFTEQLFAGLVWYG